MARRVGQIDMFTRRVKKIAKPSPKETAIQIALADTLRKGGLAPGWLWWHVPNGELRTELTGALLQRMGVQPGVSDLHFLSPLGELHALELKRKGKQPNDEQEQFLSAVDSRPHSHAGWADSYDKAIEILRGWGALSDRLHTQ